MATAIKFENSAAPASDTSKGVSLPPINMSASPLSCGLRFIQNWSEGIGIHYNHKQADNFERAMTTLIYFSKKRNELTRDWSKSLDKHTVPGLADALWDAKDMGQDGWVARIGVTNNKFQFLAPGQNNLISSKKHWVERFEKFVKDNDLGAFTKTEAFKNPNYGGSENYIQVAVWTWNGKLPSKHPDWIETLKAGTPIVKY